MGVITALFAVVFLEFVPVSEAEDFVLIGSMFYIGSWQHTLLPGVCFRYQNFDRVPQVPSGRTGYYGGSVILADYCPYIQEFTWKSNNVIVRGSHCAFPDNNPCKRRARRNATVLLGHILQLFLVMVIPDAYTLKGKLDL